jgi:hypothetical protein
MSTHRLFATKILLCILTQLFAVLSSLSCNT